MDSDAVEGITDDDLPERGKAAAGEEGLNGNGGVVAHQSAVDSEKDAADDGNDVDGNPDSLVDGDSGVMARQVAVDDLNGLVSGDGGVVARQGANEGEVVIIAYLFPPVAGGEDEAAGEGIHEDGEDDGQGAHVQVLV